MINKKVPDEDLTKTDDTTISSSSSKKYKKKRTKAYAKINYSITNPLSSIKESNNSLIENDGESFCLLPENIDKEEEKYIKIEESSNDKEEIKINDSDSSVDNSLKKNSENKKEEKSGKKSTYKKKEEKFIDIDISNYCYNISDNEDNNKSKGYSKASSKNKIDLKFLDEEEKEEENANDSLVYVQKANDEEDKYKIIYEFNKLPFKPKTQILDLSIFDTSSILKVIIKYYFEKSEQNFIIKFNFVYISNQNNKLNSNELDELIQENIDNPLSKDDNSKEEDDEDYLNDNDTLEITLQLKRFKLNKGTDRNGTRRKIKLRKVDIFEKFRDSIEIIEKEDLFNYKTYHKIFYTLTIQKNIFIKSKKFFIPNKIGIQNEGNTCYMNSIIQSLYNNQFILKKIMEIDPEKNELLNLKEKDKEKAKDVIIALQEIFYNLFTKKKEINILEIFYAFNWKRTFWNSPQDAQEIYMKIFEIISEYNNEIKDNCEVILENTIEVEEINYKSTKEENFFFMQLDIEKNNSVDECLEHFFESEKLNGDNKYQYENNKGEKILYDAEKYYKFKKIPNFLFLQLKRFNFTFDTDTYTLQKKNKAISYKEEIDLSKYIHMNKSKSKKQINTKDEIYTLYCILIHSGSAENGHYYCIARDFQNKVFIKYNDTIISTVEKKEVFNELFGGEEIEYSIQNINKDKPKLEPRYEVIDEKKEIKRNAYILIYVKKNKIKELFNEDNIKEIFNSFAKKKRNKNGITYNYKVSEEKEYENNNDMSLMRNKNFRGASNNRNRITYPKKINSIDRYDYKKYKEKIKGNNNLIDMNVKDFSFSELCSNFKTFNNYSENNEQPKKRNMESYKNSKNQLYSYVGGNTYNSKKIYDKYSNSKNVSMDMINGKRVNFYLIPEISKRIKGILSIKYNTNIYVKDIVGLIKEQLILQKNTENIRNTLEIITKSEGYKLAIINSFGFFINFLENDYDDVTNLLNQKNEKTLKHLCLYNFKEINNGRKINNLIAVHFMNKSLVDKIIKDKDQDIYNNYQFENINIPAFIINQVINDENVLIDKIKDLYIDYFGSLANKNIKFKIYIITGDIRDLDVLKIKYKELDHLTFIIDFNSSSSDSYNKKYNITRLLVAI